MRSQAILLLGLVLLSIGVGFGVAYLSNPDGWSFTGASWNSALPASDITSQRPPTAPAAVTPPTARPVEPTIVPAAARPTTTRPTAVASASQPSAVAMPNNATAGAGDEPQPAELLLQVGEREAALRNGALVAELRYSGGARAEALVRFDLGDATHQPRFHITTTYSGTNSVTTVERITVGDQSWERQQAGRWVAGPAREPVLKQLQVFLPRTDAIADVAAVQTMGSDRLQWYDSARDANVLLRLAPDHTPLTLRRESELNGLLLTVEYSAWNRPVAINAPDLP